MLDYCERRGIAFVPWRPVARAATSGTADPITTIAERLGATRAQIALAWLLRRSPVMVPIPGTSSLAHLEENIAAGTVTLDADDMAQLAQRR